MIRPLEPRKPRKPRQKLRQQLRQQLRQKSQLASSRKRHTTGQLSIGQRGPGFAWGRWLGSLGIGVLLVSCGLGGRPSGPDRPTVVVTSTILTDLTQRVAGDEVIVKGLLRPGDDPHLYEPVPRDTVAIERADRIFYNGYNLEPGIIKLIQSSGQTAKAVAIGERVPALTLPKQGATVPDPHVWGSARNGMVMVMAIRDELSKLSPGDRAAFAANADRLLGELQQLDQWIGNQIQTIPTAQRRLVTTHDAFQYYAQAYKIPVLGTLIGISTEEQPSAQTMARMAAAIRQAKVPAIFAETTINPALIETVAAESGVTLAPDKLYADSIGVAGGPAESYVKMLAQNTRSIVRALGGHDRPFAPSLAPASAPTPSSAPATPH